MGKNGLHVAGELQVVVPYQLYRELMKRHDAPLSDLVAGIDVNVERIDVATISPSRRLKTVKTFWLDGAVHMGVKREESLEHHRHCYPQNVEVALS